MSPRNPNSALLAFAQGRTAKAAAARAPSVRVRISFPPHMEASAATDMAKQAPPHREAFGHDIPSANVTLTIKGPYGTVKGPLLEMVRVEGGYVITIDTDEGPMNFLVRSEQAHRLGLLGRPRIPFWRQAAGGSFLEALIVDVELPSPEAEAGASA